MNYWINTVSHDHVRRGVEGGFTQANHGKATHLRQLAQDDRIIFYSPRTSYPDGEPLQCFTALGHVLDAQPYQVENDPLIGLFAGPPDLSEQAETILEQDAKDHSGWTWKTSPE